MESLEFGGKFLGTKHRLKRLVKKIKASQKIGKPASPNHLPPSRRARARQAPPRAQLRHERRPPPRGLRRCARARRPPPRASHTAPGTSSARRRSSGAPAGASSARRVRAAPPRARAPPSGGARRAAGPTGGVGLQVGGAARDVGAGDTGAGARRPGQPRSAATATARHRRSWKLEEGEGR